LTSLGRELGLLMHNSDDFLKNMSNYTQEQIKEIEMLLNMRDNFRKLKNWEKADNIRKILLSLGIVIEDDKNKTVWYRVKKI
ncbi:cysteine--tRNA ligase, partial [Buchnera aphidicola (Pemphigus obesinymphae)]|nr:cysteine--tRNA ligase [Buchnera aphidicola (Pemphigus obesinymphae)]